MAEAPSFAPKFQIPISEIIAGYQRKAQQQQQQQNENVDRVAQIVNGVTNLTSTLVAQSKAKQMQDATNALSAAYAQPSGFSATGQMKPAGSSLFPKLNQAPEMSQSYTPEDLQNMQALAVKINPNKAAENIIDEASKKMFNPEGTRNQSRFQQSSIQIPDPKTGEMKTYATTFDQTTGQQLNPMTGKPILSPEDAHGLMERGYAQGKRSAGYNLEGKEVVADQRSGAKFIIEINPETGMKSEVPYNGVIYPKKENIPAGLSDSLGELNYSGKVLDRMMTTFNESYVGPVAARAGKMSQYVGTLTEADRVAFYGNVSEYKNSIIKAITGAQMSEVEAKRIIQQIPNENASPKAYMAGLKRAYNATQERISAKEAQAVRSGGVLRGSAVDSNKIKKELNAKFDKILGTDTGGAPVVGGMFQGQKILKVKKISN
jgi:hypothetical protein